MTKYVRVIEKDTSVKSIGVVEEVAPNKAGVCDFIYRDQYSIFDWGKMPMPEGVVMDNRPVAVIAAYNYELVSRLGFSVCYLGAVDKDCNAHDFNWFKSHNQIPNAIRLHMVNRIKPVFRDGHWDYSEFKKPSVNNYIIPIEFIWRAEAGQDSSFWNNIKKGCYALNDFGLSENIKQAVEFPFPVLDHSSKYEDHDRYFSPFVAKQLSGLNINQWRKLDFIRYSINDKLTKHAKSIGIHRPDGKQEFCIINQDENSLIYLGDVCGTWHEDRFEYTTKAGNKVKVSKQTPRDLNLLINKEWAQQCTLAKERAEKEGISSWKHLVTEQPKSLEPEFFKQYNNLMYAATNAWVGWNMFSGASDLETACSEFHKYTEDYKKRINNRSQ